jgi:tetratricopeptide (TPR) repeat protein
MATSQLAEGLERCMALRRHLRDDTAATDAARFWDTVARLGQYSTNRECYDAALRAADLYRKLGDTSRLYDALANRASQGIRYGEVEQVQRAIDEASGLERPEWQPRQRAQLEFSRFRWNTMIGHQEAALACALRQVALYREDGSVYGELVAMSNVTSAEIALGHPEAALEHARAAIAQLRTIGSESAAGHLHLAAMIALTMLGHLDEAIAEGRTAHALLVREADEFRLLLPLALNAALRGRLADAARIIGLVDVVLARTGEVPRPLDVRRRARLDALLNAGLTAEALAQHKAAGATMREADAFKLAFGDIA